MASLSLNDSPKLPVGNLASDSQLAQFYQKLEQALFRYLRYVVIVLLTGIHCFFKIYGFALTVHLNSHIV